MKIVVLIKLKADFRHAGGAVVPPDDERIPQERFEDGPRLLPLLSADLPVVIHVERRQVPRCRRARRSPRASM